MPRVKTGSSAGLQACRYILIVVGAFVCLPAILRAQAAPKNLQVLPKDTPAQDVVAQMQQFTRALGVPCTYCHIEQTAPLLSVEELQAQQAAAAAVQAAAAAAPPAAAGR